MTTWNTVATDEIVEKTMQALIQNGISAISVVSKDEAKMKVLELIPKQSEVMTMTSVTLDQTGIAATINDTGDFDAIKPRLYALNRETQGKEMQKMGAAADYSIGSVHAITQDGVVVIASNTGSQLSGYAYGSSHVIFVVGTQKIVPTLDDAMNRVYEYVLPLESERAHNAYGVASSNVSKLLIISKEVNPSRITVIFVKEPLGF